MLPVLETERLILRSLRLDDLDDFYVYTRNINVAHPAGFEPPQSIEDSRKTLEKFMNGDEVWAIEWKETSRVIGTVGLHADSKSGTASSKALGYALSEEYWNRGIVTEAARRMIRHAFEAFPIDVLRIYHFQGNNGSRRVIEKCGFVYEGTLRHIDKRADGTFEDDVCYSILREEFEAGQCCAV
ncbi:N-acetyltransferase [Clostridia bacterium]|nr:N-acetyltransferase [Clostridia bacterium]